MSGNTPAYYFYFYPKEIKKLDPSELIIGLNFPSYEPKAKEIIDKCLEKYQKSIFGKPGGYVKQYMSYWFEESFFEETLKPELKKARYKLICTNEKNDPADLEQLKINALVKKSELY